MENLPSPLSTEQWTKVVRAAAYSFFSGFFGALFLTSTNYLQNGQPVDEKFFHSLVIAAVVGGFNTLAVFVKQIFTPAK